MMYEFTRPQRFITGTVGEPGSRAFFVQVRGVCDTDGMERTMYAGLEKQQAGALAEKLDELLEQLEHAGISERPSGDGYDSGPLDSPVEEDFRVGSMTLQYDDATGYATVEFVALVPGEVADDPDSGLKVSVSLSEAARFAQRTRAVVKAGRPPCPLCSRPLDPAGHVCPRANGYRR